MQAYILCGGFGTRLHNQLKGSQKAVVDIHGQPFLSLVLTQLQHAGVTHIVLCAYYRADQLEEYLPKLSADAGLHVQLVVEPEPMGTGGALLHALREVPPTGRYLALNADTFLGPLAYRIAMKADRDILVAAPVSDRTRYGSLDCADDGRVSALYEKGLSGPGLVNVGVYGFCVDALQGVPIVPCSMEHDILPVLIEQRRLFLGEYVGPFVDIGTPDSLESFRRELQVGEIG